MNRRYFHKFRAKQTELDGIKFASKKEAHGYEIQKARQAAGEVLFFIRQTSFHLPGGVRYVCDFTTFDADGTVHFLDYKGMKTESYKAKKRMVEALYPVEIEEL